MTITDPMLPDNSAIRWDATRFGLLPLLSETAEELEQAGEALIPTLLDALLEPQHFVVAHVLLTRITGIRYETFPTWNGLSIELRADGEVHIDAEQRHELYRRWQSYFQTKPETNRLPP
ncbi:MULTISPECIES: hypothetical protein [Caldilinea]|jgi:hypothetical protein|uniref:Uncharacterized protein n=1 Tax=Caldilinea aerophila (strain DSM 14535 / JCM 11387 / NBRC 104270 / STL-6-O1) TaxID=926550 RepID=I0IA43_CALAS|nr:MULTISPECIES: hypothetical protein [Caldilinea]BAM02131.1 hypothetical protein CLDAP_40910 [Caldilinea aerophila DSM 14535 = NBRC 104270]GIV75330.1 MAG: hypothetical protein KatS3mg049_3886 [Caldilinea sp.]